MIKINFLFIRIFVRVVIPSSLVFVFVLVSMCFKNAGPTSEEGWELAWSDEFNYTGIPDTAVWAVLDTKDKQVSKECAEVKDGMLQLSLKQIDGQWRCAYLSTAPDIVGKAGMAVGGPHDRKLFAAPPGGRARMEVKFRGVNAKGGGAMISGMSNQVWLFSHPTPIPSDSQPPIKSLRGEIDMIEHASPAGGKPWITSIHITEWPGLKWGEGGKANRRKSSTFSITPTKKGDFWDNTDWHIIVAEWGHDGVSIYFDDELITQRTTLKAPKDTERKDGWDPADLADYRRIANPETGKRYTGNNITARYFAFDEKFPMAFMLSSFLHREPGPPGAGIGPAENEPTDFDALPFTMYYDYVRFYVTGPAK